MQLALVGLDGIEQVRVFLGSSTLQVTHDPEKIAVDDIAAAVRRAPWPVNPAATMPFCSAANRGHRRPRHHSCGRLLAPST